MRQIRRLAVLILVLLCPTASLQADPAADPLDRPELDQEISIDAPDMDVRRLFETVSLLTGVPFRTEIPAGVDARITLKSHNVNARSVLTMLANNARLEYSAGEKGEIVVRTRAKAGEALRSKIIQERRVTEGDLIELTLQIGKPGQAKRESIKVRGPLNGEAELKKHATERREVTTLGRCAPERRSIGGFTLRFCAKNITETDIELMMELTHSRALGDRQYSDEHTFETRTIRNGEPALLFATEDFDITLSDWKRLEGKRTEVVIDEKIEG